MVEDIAEADDELMNKYLEAGELSAEELKTGLRKGVTSGSIIPVICGSAVKRHRRFNAAWIWQSVLSHRLLIVDRLKAQNPEQTALKKDNLQKMHPFRPLFLKRLPIPTPAD
ncbi:MAG: hypothetical protein MZV70_28020 [Desulfobacterales bacterium]|nr:hypothetical protein [Desulfobacterales bacterium]